MSLLQDCFATVSGVDSNHGATIVFAWCRNKGPGDIVLLGSAQVVGGLASGRPPGIQTGQFSVTILLPPGCSVDEVFVTDNAGGAERLTGITVTPCQSHSYSPQDRNSSVPAELRPKSQISLAASNGVTSQGRS